MTHLSDSEEAAKLLGAVTACITPYDPPPQP